MKGSKQLWRTKTVNISAETYHLCSVECFLPLSQLDSMIQVGDSLSGEPSADNGGGAHTNPRTKKMRYLRHQAFKPQHRRRGYAVQPQDEDQGGKQESG